MVSRSLRGLCRLSALSDSVRPLERVPRTTRPAAHEQHCNSSQITIRSMRIITIAALYLSAGVLMAGETRMPFELEDGQKSFLANCAVCHGPDGNSVVGIDLAHGKLRRATSDDVMVKIIREGIPGTSMPPNRDFSKYEASSIVSYLRWMGSTDTDSIELGDAANGKAIFEGNGRCLECHRV